MMHMYIDDDLHCDWLRFKWRVDDAQDGARGMPFRFQDSECRLICSVCDCYRIYLSFTGHRKKPFDAVVEVENGAGRVLPELKTETHSKRSGSNTIWSKTKDDIVRAYPEFGRGEGNNHELCFRVLLKSDVTLGEECTCTTCQFAAADNIPSLESFSKDLGNLLDQNVNTDVEFRCVDADDNILTTVKAHNLVVCLRSPVLAAMLNSDMVEGRTGVATIKDIDAGVFKQFLKYLYSGKLEETTLDAAMSLYEAGDRFQVKSLNKHCARRLVKNLTIENSCEILVVADAHGDEALAEVTLAFMVNAKVPHVFDGWEDFCSKQPELSARVINRFCEMFNGMSPKGEYSCSKRRWIVSSGT